jgi:hypothetical protein
MADMLSRPARLLLLLAVVLSLQCRPMARYRGEVQQCLLHLGHSSGGPAPYLEGADVFDGGVVTLSEGSRTWFSVISPADVEEIGNIATDPHFTKLLTTLRERHFEKEYSDYEEIFLYVTDGDQSLGCELPTPEIPEELQPYLVRIDRILGRAFGRRYTLRVAERRHAK